jgi:hypothetical protein
MNKYRCCCCNKEAAFVIGKYRIDSNRHLWNIDRYTEETIGDLQVKEFYCSKHFISPARQWLMMQRLKE